MKGHPIWRGYFSDSDGVVYGKRGKPLKPILHHTGYTVITVRGAGSQKQVRLHRFIYECFHGLIIDQGLVINHIDGDKTNNALSNLELVTHAHNAAHAFETGLRKGKRGQSSHFCHTSDETILRVIDMINSGWTNKAISDSLDIDHRRVSDIRHGKKWKDYHHMIKEV